MPSLSLEASKDVTPIAVIKGGDLNKNVL